MSYREITVCLDREENVKNLALIASRLGAGLHAYVNGVHAIPDVVVENIVVPYIDAKVTAQIREQLRTAADSMRSTFKSIMDQGDTHWQWREHRCDHSSDFQPYLDYALNSDIVVTGQSSAKMSGGSLQRELLLKVGTPVIVTPVEEPIDVFAQRIGVAWNGTPEAARAVRDAMPLLANADEVQVITVNAEQDTTSNTAARRLTLNQYLEHHRINYTRHDLQVEHQKIGLSLLDHAKVHNLDLLLMGGFGHSRLYDVVVGAATGAVLRNTHIPLFLSH